MDTFKQEEPKDESLHFLDYWRIIRIRKTVILAVFLLVVLTTTVVTFLLPESFSSTVEIEVKKDFSDLKEMGGATTIQGFDPYFLQNEFKKIQSKVVLYQVISNLNLGDYYKNVYNLEVNLKPEETYLYLSSQLSVNQQRNTELIEITVFDRDKLKAKTIANEIANVYRDWRMDLSKARFSQGFQSISNRLEEAKTKVRISETNIAQLADELEITDIDDFTIRGALSLDVQTIQQFRNQYDIREIEHEQTLKLLSELRSLSREDLKIALPTSFQEASLTASFPSLFQTEADLKRQLAGLSEELGPEHQRIKGVRAELRTVQETIDQRLGALLRGLEANENDLATEQETLKQEIERKEREYRARTDNLRPYKTAEQELERRRNVRDSVEMKMEQERINFELSSSFIVTVINPAEEALRPAMPNKKLNIALGVVVGLVVGVGLAFFIEYLDTSVKTIDDVERALQAHVLGVIPQNVGSLLEEGADSPHAEAYRVLRTNVLFSRASDDMNTVTVVSGGAGEGKSTTLFNLATIFAQNDARVLVVDSDLRRPSIHKILKTSNNVGLTNFLLEQMPLDEVIQKTGLESLDFLPSGKLPSSSMGIISSVKMKDLVKQLKERYDFVFFDSPPIMGVSDASVLASEVDITLQVIQYRRYPQPMTIRAKQMIQKVGGNLLGVVLNNINMAQDENYYYYSGYYYDYYSKHSDDEETEPQKNGKTASSDTKQTSEASRIDLKKY
jgi:capsular exopolysaccharide synthesis family protein